MSKHKHQWQLAYEFERGKTYLIEADARFVEGSEIQHLVQQFEQQGIKPIVVLTHNGEALRVVPCKESPAKKK